MMKSQENKDWERTTSPASKSEEELGSPCCLRELQKGPNPCSWVSWWAWIWVLTDSLEVSWPKAHCIYWCWSKLFAQFCSDSFSRGMSCFMAGKTTRRTTAQDWAWNESKWHYKYANMNPNKAKKKKKEVPKPISIPDLMGSLEES